MINYASWQTLFSNYNKPHYRVGDKKFHDRLSAMIEANILSKIKNQPPEHLLKFVCFDEELADSDWSQEPLESYKLLSEYRALQLKQTYNYIRLWYSGGADSHSTLMSFYRAGIPINEIVVIANKSLPDDQNPSTIETNGLTIPLLKSKIQQMFPSSKISIINYTIDYDNTSDDWHNHFFKNSIDYPTGRVISKCFDLDSSLLTVYEKGLKVCELVGEPKPNIVKKNGKWYSYIIDSTLETVVNIPNLEMFHFSPSFLPLYIKQSHMLKRGYERLLQGNSEQLSLDLNKNLAFKNSFLERSNEFDIENKSIQQWTYGKMVDANGDKGYNLLIIPALRHNNAAMKYLDYTQDIFHNEIYDKLPTFFDKGKLFKGVKGILSNFWCLDAKETLTPNELWPNGFGNY